MGEGCDPSIGSLSGGSLEALGSFPQTGPELDFKLNCISNDYLPMSVGSIALVGDPVNSDNSPIHGVNQAETPVVVVEQGQWSLALCSKVFVALAE
jgi:hypothetical protein